MRSLPTPATSLRTACISPSSLDSLRSRPSRRWSPRERAAELIHVKDLQKVTGYIRGGCTAIGMKKDYPTVIDETCILFDKIMVSGGRLGSQIMLSPDDYIRATGAKCLPIIF